MTRNFSIGAALLLVAGLAGAAPKPIERRDGHSSAASVIVRGFDPVSAIDGAQKALALQRAIPDVKAVNPAGLQTRVLWSVAEPREGQFDWSGYDSLADTLRKNGLRWSPLLVLGGIDGPPSWLRLKQGYQPLTCVEHNQESPLASRWYPLLRSAAAKFVRAFGERYGKSGLLESVTLGIAGADGSAALPHSNQSSAGHLHAGLWNNDEYAVDAFRIWLASKYGGSTPLRDAWGGLTQGLSNVQSFLKRDAATERAWIDQLDFLSDSISQWSLLWLKEGRTALPKTPLYLRTAAHSPPESGVDLALLARAAADSGAGLQVVIETEDQRTILTRASLAGACASEFGIPLRLEAAGPAGDASVSAVLFASSAYSAGRVIEFSSVASPPIRERLKGRLITPAGSPRNMEIAVYHPQMSARLLGTDPMPAIQPLRDRFDFDLVSDAQILAGALTRYKALVMVQGNVSESRVWRELYDWVRKGGLLIHPEGMGNLTTVERDNSYHSLIFGAQSGAGPRALSLPYRGNSVAYREQVSRVLNDAPELSPAARVAISVDAEEDGVYVTGHSHRLWLNLGAVARQKHGTTISPFSVTPESATTRR